MRTLLLTGNHPRHHYIAKSLAEADLLSAVIIEKREAFVPEPPTDLDPHLSQLYIKHFREREEAEHSFFGNPEKNLTEIPTINVTKDELNSSRVWEFVELHQPQLVISYGVHFLKEETLARFPQARWNIHGGLSPWYRGCITMFWPSYMLEPQMTGVTVHQLSMELDGGPIIHQCSGPLVRGDGIHQLACRSIQRIAKEMPMLIAKHFAGDLKPPQRQRSPGKLWTSRDWRPEHLHLIYDIYQNRIVDHYLDGKFRHFEPQTVRQL